MNLRPTEYVFVIDPSTNMKDFMDPNELKQLYMTKTGKSWPGPERAKRELTELGVQILPVYESQNGSPVIQFPVREPPEKIYWHYMSKLYDVHPLIEVNDTLWLIYSIPEMKLIVFYKDPVRGSTLYYIMPQTSSAFLLEVWDWNRIASATPLMTPEVKRRFTEVQDILRNLAERARRSRR